MSSNGTTCNAEGALSSSGLLETLVQDWDCSPVWRNEWKNKAACEYVHTFTKWQIRTRNSQRQQEQLQLEQTIENAASGKETHTLECILMSGDVALHISNVSSNI
jgi:hypothetical protein